MSPVFAPEAPDDQATGEARCEEEGTVIAREVISRRLVRVVGGLPVMVDHLICGHLIVDPGKCSKARLCLACAWEKRAPERARHMPDYRDRPVCGNRRHTVAKRLEMVTCLRCIQRGWLVPWRMAVAGNRARGRRKEVA